MKTVKVLFAALAAMLVGFVVNAADGGGIVITPTTLPDATVGVPYSQVLTVDGVSSLNGANPRWSPTTRDFTVRSDTSAKTFTISGTPTAAGTYSLTLQVFCDGGAVNFTQTYTLAVNPAGGTGGEGGEEPPSVVTPTLKSAAPSGYNSSGTVLPLELGNSVDFSVELENPSRVPVSYSWTSNGAQLSTAASFRWTPRAAGRTSVRCSVMYDGRAVVTLNWMYNITEPVIQPTIERDYPASAEVSMSVGDSLEFGAKVEGDISGYSGAWSVKLGETDADEMLSAVAGDPYKVTFAPTAAGEYWVVFTATPGSGGDIIQACWHVTVAAGSGEGDGGDTIDPIVMPVALPPATVGVAYSQVLTVVGATVLNVATPTWSPATRELTVRPDTTGNTITLSGTPTAAGLYVLTLEVVFDNARSFTQCFELEVQAASDGEEEKPEPVLSRANPSDRTVTMTVDEQIRFQVGIENGDELTGGQWYQVVNGARTAISGETGTSYLHTATAAGSYTLLYQAVANGKVYSVNWNIAVTAPEPPAANPSITPTDLPAATVGVAYSQVLTVDGVSSLNGANPRWSPTTRDFTVRPDTAAKSLTIAGTPTAAGTYSLTLQVFYDGGSGNFTQTFTLVVNPAGGGEGGEEEKPEPVLSRANPSDRTVTMTVDEQIRFQVGIENGDELTGGQWYQVVNGARTAISGETGTSYLHTATAAGSYTLLYQAVANGKVYSVDWNVAVTAPEPPAANPSIKDASPVSLEMESGETQTLVVEVENETEDVGYQWYEMLSDGSGGVSANPIRDATAATYAYTHTDGRRQLQVRVYSLADSSVVYGTKNWTITTKEPEPPPVVNPTISSASPAGYNSSMTTLEAYVNEAVSLSVEVDNPSGVAFTCRWMAAGRQIGDSASCSWTPDKAGVSSVSCYLVVNGSTAASVVWRFNVTSRGGEGGETSEVSITPAELPAATAGTAYSQTLTVNGVSVLNGVNSSTLSWRPSLSGLTVRANNQDKTISITGTPSASGTYTLSLPIRYNGGQSMYTQEFTLVVNPAGGGEGGEEDDPPATVPTVVPPTTVALEMANGEQRVLSVEVSPSDADVEYAWYRYNTTIQNWQPMSAVTTSSYTYHHGSSASSLQVGDTVQIRVAVKKGSQIYGDKCWTITTVASGEGGGEDTPEPSFTRLYPATQVVNLTLGETVTFQVAEENVGTMVNRYWDRDGSWLASEGSSYTYTATAVGTFTINFTGLIKSTQYPVQWIVVVTQGGGGNPDRPDRPGQDDPPQTSFLSRVMPGEATVTVAVGRETAFAIATEGDDADYGLPSWSVKQNSSDVGGLVDYSQTSRMKKVHFLPEATGVYTVEAQVFSKVENVYRSVTWTVLAVDGPLPPSGPDWDGRIRILELGEGLDQRVSLEKGEFEAEIVDAEGNAYQNVAALGEWPEGVSLANGRLTGTMSDDLAGERIRLAVTRGEDAPVTVTLLLAVRTAKNMRPYLVSATPAETAITCNLGVMAVTGEGVHLEVDVRDEEGDPIDYNWYIDGVRALEYYSFLGAEYDYRSFLDFSSANTDDEGVTKVVSCYAVEGGVDTLVATWEITFEDPEFDFNCASEIATEVGRRTGDIGLRFHMPMNESIELLELVDGDLPPGIALFMNGLIGKFRRSGEYSFTLRAVCSNGAVKEKSFHVTVTGEDTEPLTLHATSANPPNSLQYFFETQGLCEGDTLYIHPVTGEDSKGAMLLQYVHGARIVVTGGERLITVGMYVPDVTGWELEDGGSLAFAVDWTYYRHFFDDFDYGGFVRLAKVGTDHQVGDFRVVGIDPPYFIDTEIDGEGYLGFHVGARKEVDRNNSYLADTVGLADILNRRDARFAGVELRSLRVVSSGVLPGRFTADGLVRITTTGYRQPTIDPGVDLYVTSNGVLQLDTDLYAPHGDIVFEPGSTLRLNGGSIINRRIVLPQAGQPKLRLELAAELPRYSERRVFSVYSGTDDPAAVIEVVPPPDSPYAGNYHVEIGPENSLVVSTRLPTGDGDPGQLDWTDDDGGLGSVSQFGQFSYSFQAKAPKTGGGDLYHDYAYEFKDPLFSVSRAGDNTFDGASGERDPAFAGGAASATLDLGFPFPFENRHHGKVTVSAGGRLSIGGTPVVLLEKGRLPTFVDCADNVFVSRGEGTFTVRYGGYASVTLCADGTVRMAFGPEADDLPEYENDVQICRVGDRSFTSPTLKYAGEPDVVFTPNGYPVGLSFSGSTLSGSPFLAGDYSFRVKVTAKDDENNVVTLTRSFQLSVDADAGDRTPRPTLSVVSAPAAGADGVIHLNVGDQAGFAVAAGEGEIVRWTIEGVAPTTSTPTGSTYGFSTANPGFYILSAEANDSHAQNPMQGGYWNWSVRRVWYIAVNRTVYVDAANTGVQNGRTSETAYRDFGATWLRELIDGDEIVVAPGTYAGALDFGTNPAKVTVRSTGSAADTVLDAGGTKRCFRQLARRITYGADGVLQVIPMPVRNAVVRGLSLTGGYCSTDGDCEKNEAVAHVRLYGVAGGGALGGTFEDCQIYGCTAARTDFGGGHYPESSYGGGAYGARLVRCVIAQNTADIGGGCSNCELVDCTVADNEALVAAGGVDGECSVSKSIIRYNFRGETESETEPTYTPSRLVADRATLDDCFTAGDPEFCCDYRLAAGSPAAGYGAYPVPEAARCRVLVELVGAGTVEPYDPDGIVVENGAGCTFTASGRDVARILVNGVEVPAANPFVLGNVTKNSTVRFEFAPVTLHVGEGGDYATIQAAVDAASSGDTIEVAPGVYDGVDVSAFDGSLTLVADGAEGETVIDGRGTRRCVVAGLGRTDVLFRGFTLVNGYAGRTAPDRYGYLEPGAIYSEPDPVLHTVVHHDMLETALAFGHGGGVVGGSYDGCTISNCTAVGGFGGGALMARLENCRLLDNTAGCKTGSMCQLPMVKGGGAYGGYLYNCQVNGNWIKSGLNGAVADGAGVCNAETRYSFVWGNFSEIGAYSQPVSSNAKAGENGVVVHTSDRVPTAKRLEERKEPILPDEVKVYDTAEEAQAAAAKQTVDIATPVAKTVPDQEAYIDMFEIKTVEEDGKFVNKPVLKEEVVEIIQQQIENVLTEDDDGNQRTEYNVQKMEKTLTETLPGLYYALEFATSLELGDFHGDRHLSTGSGSVKLSAVSLNTSSGFWRVAIYTSPTGD